MAGQPGQHLGLVVQQESAAGYVIYDFCSELGLSPCTLAQAPQQAIFQKGANGYAGNRVTLAQAPKLTVWYRP